MTKAILGIDTSNYTTSCAIVSINGEVLENFKILLPVKDGERGLRQSDAVFAHIKNFQIIADKLKEVNNKYEFMAVGYSAFPRDCEGSYMPCFLVGKSFAEMISALYCIPSYAFSHQSGHICAALYSSGAEFKEDFIAFHVSGGTTEVLYVQPDDEYFTITKIGGSNDLHAGQVIDRIGVEIGIGFPCGKEMEKLALNCTDALPKFKVSVQDYECNLSGLENLAKKLLMQTDNKALVSKYVFHFIGECIKKITYNLKSKYGNIGIVYAGGVMSNTIIKNEIKSNFNNVYFAEPQFSTDNAVGVALLARKKYIL